MRFRNAEVVEQRDRVGGHQRHMVARRFMWLVALPMAAIVDGDHTVAGIAERLQPARMHPVDQRRRGKAVDQEDRIARRIALIEKGKLQSVVLEGGKGGGVEMQGLAPHA